MPGILAGIVGAIFAAIANTDSWGERFVEVILNFILILYMNSVHVNAQRPGYKN
jgi:hypothetical protein